jgi:hypothetical protein
MLVDSRLDKSFWGEAIVTKTFLENISPPPRGNAALIHRTPYEVFIGRRPDVRMLRVFGSPAIIRNPHAAGKLAPRGLKVIFVGYSPGTKGWRFYNPVTRKIIVERSAMFYENRNFGKIPDEADIPGYSIFIPDEEF